MISNSAIGFLFANMHDECLPSLSANRAMGSVPFGGRYRLIDFALSGMVNAGISRVGVITKRNYFSLMDHLGSGKAWDLSRKTEGLSILPPVSADAASYVGRVDSLLSAREMLRAAKRDYVVLCDCHMAGSVDMAALLEAHRQSQADVTVAYKEGMAPAFSDNLILAMRRDKSVKDIAIGSRPEQPCCYGVGLYVIGRQTLIRLLDEAAGRNSHHFERDILQRQLGLLTIAGYPIKEYTVLIDSLQTYFNANMALLEKKNRQNMFCADRPVYTKVRDYPAAIYGLHSSVNNSLIGEGAHIEGTVRNSIIFRDVQIAEGAVVENSIVMQGSVISKAAQLGFAVLDKNVTIKEQRSLKGVETFPFYITKGETV